MYRFRFLFALFVITGLAFFSSCDNDGGDDIPKKTGVLIVNEGNFGSGNGSISFYDEEQMTISNNVVKNTNNGNEVGATVQSIYENDGIVYLICNSSDKIEFISIDDFKYLANPETNISQPRYMTAVGDKGYITCWGLWGDNWTLPDSYIAVMDLDARSVVDTLESGSGPEGIIAVGTKLFVANSYETSVSVIDISDNSATKIQIDAAPKRFALDGTGALWVSTSAGLQVIDTESLEKGDAVAVTNMDGKMAIDGSGEMIYMLTAEPWPGTKTEVSVFNTSSKTLSPEALISGDNFYGIGYNPTTDKLYVADAVGFSGIGKIIIYNAEGTFLDDQETSIGPNGFMFK